MSLHLDELKKMMAMIYYLLVDRVDSRQNPVHLSKDLSTLNARIQIILPIALSIALPGIGFVANNGKAFQGETSMLTSWAYASTVLYIYWYFIWFLWDFASRRWSISYLLQLVALLLGGGGLFLLMLYLEHGTFHWFFLGRLALISVMFSSIQYALKSQENISQLRLETEQLQTENYKTQLKALQAQIDPHFLFNSLNTLRAMVRQQHTNSEQFVMSLSDFYRQTLKHNENTTIRLSEELTVLESYLFVMGSRNEAAVQVSIDIADELKALQLPTMALQVIVENCFKHNSMTTKQTLQITITNTADNYLQISNNLQPKLGTPEPSGYGLDLLRKRYALLGITDGVVVESTPTHFNVKLKLIAA